MKIGLIRRLFAAENMVGKDDLRGELPKSKEIYRDLIKIAFPSVIEMVFMSIIGSIDTVMVGTLGYQAIAAVGLVGQPRMLMLSLFFAMNIGVTAIVARRKGEDSPEEANRTLRNALVLIMGITVVVMALVIPFSRQLLTLAGAQPDTIERSNTYFRILAWFLPINALTMCINAAQRGVGNTRITMYTNVTANIVNVIFNYLLIGGNLGFPRLEVAGAAYATGIGFVTGFLLCVFAVFRNRKGNAFLRISAFDDWRLKKETVKSIVKVGGNAMTEQIAVRIGFFAYAAIVANLGTEAFAAHQIAMQFLGFSFTFGDGLAVAGTSLVGQTLGQKRPDLSMIYGKCCQRIALLVSIVLAAIVITFRYPLVGIFINGNDPANVVPYSLAINLMFMVAAFQPVQMSSIVISGCLRGAGDNLYVALIMGICIVLIRPPLTLFAINVLNFSVVGAWASSLIDMCTRLTLMYLRFAKGKWQSIKV